ncbi:hypothetical protein DB32_000543 [Sandaracinus amylolyticus]|uniref:Uncharacterized protein n=1 Tax=Sandaracinus amylolyticus TaxID=927083 RepID=A0A0F6SDG3_9BACT|nr:hypothetical protein DB32_000543 [Sandaracinus amylolyticus]
MEGQPGLFREFNEAGEPVGPIVNIREFREDDKYDTIAIPTGPIPLGTVFLFFQDIQGKRNLDTNFRTPSKLSAGESMVLDRVGLYVRSITGTAVVPPVDFKTITDCAFYELRINDLLQTQGPAIKYPSGYGLYGSTNEEGAGVVSIGVPATASVSKLVKKQMLNQNHDLQASLSFEQRQWLTAGQNPPFASSSDVVPRITTIGVKEQQGAVLVTNVLHGLLRTPVSK